MSAVRRKREREREREREKAANSHIHFERASNPFTVAVASSSSPGNPLRARQPGNRLHTNMYILTSDFPRSFIVATIRGWFKRVRSVRLNIPLGLLPPTQTHCDWRHATRTDGRGGDETRSPLCRRRWQWGAIESWLHTHARARMRPSK